MHVHQVLKSKGAATVQTVASDATVAAAAGLLSEKRIGALVVCDGDQPLGILSERDIVRELGRSGADILNGKVADLMTRRIATCSPDDSVEAIMARMTEGRFRHMPVVKAERMIGIVSIGDVVKARLSELNMEKDALAGMIQGF